MDRAELLAGFRCLFEHTALTDDQAKTCLLDEVSLCGFHTTARRRSDGDHVLLAVLVCSDDRAGVDDRAVFELKILRHDLFLYDTAVAAVTAGCEHTCEVNGISDAEILDLIVCDRSGQNFLHVLTPPLSSVSSCER